MVSLKDVCYEHIKDNFCYGLFGNFKLVIDKGTGCFNATKLCSDSGKRFRNWTRLEKSKRLLESKQLLKLESCEPYEVRLTNNDPLNKQITGQYLPQTFLNPIISWMTSRTLVKEGFVYVITTSYLESNDTYKIGYTKNFLQRLDTFNEYRHSSEPQYFIVAIYKTLDARSLETAIHKKLSEYRDEGEFFKCDIKTITGAFESENCTPEPYNYYE